MTDTPNSQKERHEARVVSAVLPEGYTAGFDGNTDNTASATASAPDLTRPEQESSLKLLGGDIHRDLFKIPARAGLHQRAATFAAPRRTVSNNETESGIPTVADHIEPGGFRRQFVQQKKGRFDPSNFVVTRNFIEFLDLYGGFAGEDLDDTDDDEAVEDEEAPQDQQPSERRPLLGRRMTSRAAKKGDAGTTKTFFTLLKAFIGTGIMFLPKAFNNGGILFSSLTLVTVSLVSTIAFHLLLQCKAQYGGGYGDLGKAIGGPKLRSLILTSVALSQIGFVCAGVVFVAQNLLSFLKAVDGGSSPLNTRALIAIQLLVLIPFSFIRQISKLGPAALVADVCILIGVVYIYWYDFSTLAQDGIHPSVVLFNPKDYTLTIGAAIFTFEGIGLLLPIQSSMSKPSNFEPLLYSVMGIITVIFTSVGLFCYATFGDNTKIEIISNYPQDSKLVNAVQFLYSVAVLVGTPVQLFPALRIMEGQIFGRRSGKRDAMTKWKKNGFRTGIVLVCGVIAIAGASNLDRFVSLIGSFACVPLVYVYPPLLHYKGVADNKWSKGGDILLMLLGMVCMVYTTIVTLINSFLR